MPSHSGDWGDTVLRLLPDMERREAVDRPMPPAECAEDEPETFVPSVAFADWIRATFLLGDGPLANDDHGHLVDAHIGVLWTNAINVSKQREVIGTAEIPNANAGGWRKARFELQLRQWFGSVPHFVLTFSAPECERLDDRAFCALVSHELYHCAQALDRYGSPKFNSVTGEPIYAIRDHDVSQFIGVIEQFGMTSEEERRFVRAALAKPRFDGPTIDIACGVCMRAAA